MQGTGGDCGGDTGGKRGRESRSQSVFGTGRRPNYTRIQTEYVI